VSNWYDKMVFIVYILIVGSLLGLRTQLLHTRTIMLLCHCACYEKSIRWMGWMKHHIAVNIVGKRWTPLNMRCTMDIVGNAERLSIGKTYSKTTKTVN